MPNLLLTDFCNRTCPYCFAKEKLNYSSEKHHFLPFDHLISVLDFLDTSGEKHLNILGGEPTLHPQFSFFIRYMLGRNFIPHIFTNGMIPAKTLEDVIEVIQDFGKPGKDIRFIVNINEPHLRTREESQQQERTFTLLRENVAFSFNIYRPDQNLSFLLRTINYYKTSRYIRFGLAQPIIGEENSSISIRDYPQVVKNLMEFAEQSDAEDITFGLDCGFPLCLFSNEQIGKLYKTRTNLSFACGPPIDIGIDLDVWFCFPLSGLRTVKLTDFKNLEVLAEFFTTLFSDELFNRGIYSKCSTCQYLKRHLCMGGCIGHYYQKQNEI